MSLDVLKAVFKYDPESGVLTRNGRPVAVRQIVLDEKRYTYQRVCFALHHGYVPPYVCNWDGDLKNNAISNLYDPASHVNPRSELRDYARHGKYPGVYAAAGPSGPKGRTYQGRCRAGRTDVVSTAEMAFALLLVIKARVEWEAQQKETAQ